MKTIIFNWSKYFCILVFMVTLLSFQSRNVLPPNISGSFSNPYDNYSYVCEYPLEFVVCNNSPSAYNLLKVSFTGNGGFTNGVQVTGVSGGSGVRIISNSLVRLDLAPWECATITVNAKYANTEQNVSAFIDGVFAENVNVVFNYETTHNTCQ